MIMTLREFSEIEVPKELKPAKSYVANAIPNPNGDGYLAQFAPPGLIPRIVLNSADNSPAVFSRERLAEAEARRVLFNMLNSGPPRESVTKDKLAAYQKLTGPEFAILLAEIDVSPTWLAFIMATNYQRVMDWISGAQDVPHTARVILEIFKRHPEAIDTAEEATRAVASERVRRPSRREQPE
jgi:DNA-binding transcriptional regulator YiaG